MADVIGRALILVQPDMRSFRRNLTSGITSALKVGTALIAGTTAGMFAAAAKEAATFEKAMSGVNAIVAPTADQLKRLEVQAREAGKATVFSAEDAARAQMELGKAGASVETILSGGLNDALALAAAGEVDLAKAAEYVATGINTFNLKATESQRVADVLAAAAAESATDVESIGASMAQVGGAAKLFNIPIETTAGMLALLAQNGIKGGKAGTSLQAMLMALNPQSEKAAEAFEKVGFSAYDAEGNFIGMENVIKGLRTSLMGMTEEQRNMWLSQTFGNRSIKATAQLLLAGEEVLADWTATVSNAATKDIPAFSEATKVLGNSVTTTGFTLESATAALGVFSENGIKGGKAGTALNDIMVRLSMPTAEAAKAMRDVGFASKDSEGNMLSMSDMADNLQASMKGMTTEQKNAFMETVFGNESLKEATALFGDGGDAVDKWTKKIEESGYAAQVAGDMTDNLSGDIEKLKGHWQDALIGAGQEQYGGMREVVQSLTVIVDQLGPSLSKALEPVGRVIKDIVPLMLPVFNALLPAMESMMKLFGGLVVAVAPLATAFLEAMTPIMDALLPVLGTFTRLALAISPLIVLAGEFVALLIDSLAPAFESIVDAMIPIIEVFTEQFKAMFEDPSFRRDLMDLGEALGRIFIALLPVLEAWLPIILALTPVLVALVVPLAELLATLLELEPVIAIITGALTGWLVFQGIVTVFSAIMGAMVSLGVVSSATGAAITTAMGPITLIVAAVAGVGIAFYLAYQKIEPFRNAVDGVGRFLRDEVWPILQDIGKFIGEVLVAYVEQAIDVFKAFIKPIQDIVGAFQALLSGDISGFFEGLGDAIMSQLSFMTLIPRKIIGLLAELGPKLFEWVKTGFQWVVDNWQTVLKVIGGAFVALPAALYLLLTKTDIGQKIFDWLKGAFEWVASNYMKAVRTLLVWSVIWPVKLVGALINIGPKIWDWLKGAFDWVVDNGGKLISGIINWFKGLPETFKNAWGGAKELGSKIWQWMQSAWDIVLEKGGEILKGVGKWFSDLPEKLGNLLEAAKGLPGKIFDWIKEGFTSALTDDDGEILKGVRDWFTELPGKVIGGISDFGSALVEWVKGAFKWIGDHWTDVLKVIGAIFLAVPAAIIYSLVNFGPQLLEWFTGALTWLGTQIANAAASLLVAMIELPILLIAGMINFGASLVGWATDAFNWLATNIPLAVAAVIEWFKGLPGMIMDAIKAVMDFGASIYNWLKGAFDAFVARAGEVILGVIEWVKTIPGKMVTALVAARDMAGSIWNWIKNAVDVIVRRGGELVGGAVEFFKSIPGRVMDGLRAGGDLAGKIWGWAKSGVDVIKRRGGELAGSVKEFFTGLPGKIGGWISSGASSVSGGVGDIASKIWGSFKGFVNEKVIDKLRDFGVSVLGKDLKPFSGLPHFAEGDIVTKATAAIIGEDGPEVVIPLTKPERARELIQKSGLMDLMAEAGPGAGSAPVGAISAAVADAAAQPGVGVSADLSQQTVDNVTALAPKIIEILSVFGQTVWTAVAPSFLFLQTSMMSIFTALTAMLTVWPTTVWTAMLPGVTGLTTNILGAFTSMSASVVAEFGRMLATLTSTASSGGGGVVAALKSALDVGTTTVAKVVSGYASSLAKSLNPILRAIGEKDIDVKAFAKGGVNDPRIVGDGSYDVHVFGEKGTHGEAYIPFNPANRKRSREIANETVSRLGGQATWFAKGGVTGNTQGLDPRFLNRLGLWGQSQGQNYVVNSGYRSIERQAQMYADYLAGRKKEETAPPGRSFHNYGLASDGSRWRDRNPGAFGLSFPMGHEPWHVQPVEAAAWRAAMQAGMPMAPDGGIPGMTPLPKVPDAGKRGAISSVAAKLMEKANSAAMDWATQSSMGSGSTSMPILGDFPVNIKRILATIKTLESGGNYTARNPNSSASGAYQFTDGTWGNYGGYPRAFLAPSSVQDSKAAANVQGILNKYGNALESVPAAWYTGSYRGKGNLDYNPGGPGNPLSVQEYVNKWLSTYASVKFGNGAIIDRETIGTMGEAGREVLLPINRPTRALQLAVNSGLMNVLDGERGRTAPAPATVGAGSEAFDGGFLGGRPGNQYVIHGISLDQVRAEIRARDEVADNVL